MDGVKVALGCIGMTMEAVTQPVQQCMEDGKEWRALGYMYVFEIDADTLYIACFLTFRIVFSRSNRLSLGAWAEGHYMMRLGETVKGA